jgi:hypothetical protein
MSSTLVTAAQSLSGMGSNVSSAIVIVAAPQPPSLPTPQNASSGHGAFDAG